MGIIKAGPNQLKETSKDLEVVKVSSDFVTELQNRIAKFKSQLNNITACDAPNYGLTEEIDSHVITACIVELESLLTWVKAFSNPNLTKLDKAKRTILTKIQALNTDNKPLFLVICNTSMNELKALCTTEEEVDAVFDISMEVTNLLGRTILDLHICPLNFLPEYLR